MKMNEHYFNWSLVLGTCLIIGYLIYFGNTDPDAIVGLLGGVFFNVALFLVTGFSLQVFQMGRDRNVQQEIFDKNNIAAAIYQAGIWIGLAMVVSKGLM